MATSTPSKRNAAIFADTITVSGDTVIGGNLTVSGTTTTINTETINLADNIIVLNSNASGAATEDAGIEIERGTDTNVSLLWDEGNNRWTVGSSNFVAGTFIGALSGNASTASSAAKWTTARTLSLTGAVTGSVSIDGSGNVSLATTATSDPTLTLAGDVTGSATFTNLGNATLTATVANDSHTHAFNNLTSKDGGTGDYITTGDFIAYSFRSPLTEYDWTAAPRANQDPMSIKLYDVYTDRASGPTGSYGSLLSVYGRSSHSEAQLFFGNNSDLYFREAFYSETSYNAWQQIFTNNYHPNADTWTTARTNTVTLTGDVTGTGSASVNGSGNWTVSISTAVANDSHTHDTRYVLKTGDTMTGALQFNDANTKILEGANNALRIQTNSGWTDIGPQNTTWTHIQTDRDGFYTNKKLHVNGDIFVFNTQSQLTSSSVRAPIFYDTNNTSYYVDPAGDSVLSKMYLADQLRGGIGAKTTSGITDWNDSSNARSGNGYTLLLGSHANGPGGSYYYHPFSFEYNSKDGSGNMTQFAFDYSGATGPFFRTRYSGAWTGWTRLWNSSNDGSGSGLDADLLDGQHGSYYATASSLSGYLPLSGGTMTGTLNYRTLQNQQTSNYDTAGDSSGFSVFYGTSSATSKPSGTDHAVTTLSYSTAWQVQEAADWRTNARYIRKQENGTWSSWQRIFADDYHPNADKWTTARTNTVTLTGDVTGSGSASVDGSGNWTVNVSTAVGNNSHTHDTIDVQDVRNTTPLPSGLANKQVQSFFNNQTIPNGLSGWYSTLTVKGWDGTYAAWELAGNATSSAQDGLFFRYGSTSWNAWQRVFTDNYHPNADKWTTARTNTVTLTGDATGTGSASVDGSGNWTVSVATTVANDSHSHSNYVLKAGDTMTGTLTTTSGNNGGLYVGSGGANITSVTPSSKDIVVQDCAQFRMGGASWDWNGWAGWAWSGGTNPIYFGGPASTAFNSNASPPTPPLLLSGVSYTQSDGSMRAPIFYDSNDTSYYMDPASATRLNGYLSMGLPGAGNSTKGRWLSFEGNADTSGEGSGRLFFTEHNSTTASMDSYGFSIGYRGGSTSVTTAGGNSWTGLSQIGNGEWGMWGHNDDIAGNLIMSGDRAGTIVRFDTTLDVLGNNINIDSERGFVNSGAWTRNATPHGYIDFGPANTTWAHIYTDRPAFYLNAPVTVLNGSVINQNDIRSKIFYDLDNTNYYGNFAATSRMNSVYANQVYLAAGNSYRFRFWNGSNDYAIGMSDSGNATYGGRAPGETTSDYNMYFTMAGGTNRGFVFRNSNASTGAVAGIDSTGTGYFPQLRFGGLNPTVAYDFDGNASATSADSLAYLKFGSGVATGINIAAVECISPSWSAISGTVYTDNKFRIMSARGSAEDALRAAVNLSTVNGEGDTTIIGNVNIDGTNTRLVSGIGISGPDVYVVGDLIGSGDITAYSDERLKENIETLDGSKVYEMRGVSFTKDGKAGSGVVAQELEKVAPELVHDSGEYKSVAYGNLVGYLIEAVKELKAEVEDLKTQLAQEK